MADRDRAEDSFEQRLAEDTLHAHRTGVQPPKGTVVWCHNGIMRVFCEGGFFTTASPSLDGATECAVSGRP
jgi:hypothetical protein